VLFQDLRLAVDHENERAADIANIQRFIVLIENENGMVHGGVALCKQRRR
jgi:hypothetical protein